MTVSSGIDARAFTMDGYRVLKSLSLREGRCTFTAGLYCESAIAIEFELDYPVRAFRQLLCAKQEHGLGEPRFGLFCHWSLKNSLPQ
jgi:hypothetical protein